MTTKSILRVGDPLLRRIAGPVADASDPEIHRLIAEMGETLAGSGGIGLAAPQIGVLRRVVIFRVPDSRASGHPEDGPTPLTALVNPILEPLGDEIELGWEGCLSIPGLRGEVPRHLRVRVTATTPEGQAYEAVVAGTRARVLQHEVDHLDGVLYLDRMTDFTRFGFTEEVLEAEAGRRHEGLR